jgi:hypothetical protein
MPTFARTIGIDYSGAETPTASLKGLRVYMAEGCAQPVEVPPPPSPRKYWTRKGIAEWLVARLAEAAPTLVGIDHGFSFPLRYFEAHGLIPDWSVFLDDFHRHWPTDEDIYVDFVRRGPIGNGAARMGNARWRRLSEERAGEGLALGLSVFGIGSWFAMRVSAFNTIDDELKDRIRGVEKFMQLQISALSPIEIRDEFPQLVIISSSSNRKSGCLIWKTRN